jgi:hypothetical protein
MPAVQVAAAAYEFVVAQLEAAIERKKWPEQAGFVKVPALTADAERALRSAEPVDGAYRVMLDEAMALELASWFERMQDVVRVTAPNFPDPDRLRAICSEAARSLRASIR